MLHEKVLVRKPGRSFSKALSNHPERCNIDCEKAGRQHNAYIETLKGLGLKLEFLPVLDDCPDAVFVEDTALILDDVAVSCPMKEPSRRGEASSVIERIGKTHTIIDLPDGCEMDGGDVLKLEECIFIGLSGRTNQKAIDAVAEISKIPVRPVPVNKGLHLKSAVSFLGEDALLIDGDSVDPVHFPEFRIIPAAPEEAYSANVLKIGKTLILPKGYPRTRSAIEDENLFESIIELDMSEFEKADGGLTCLSIFINRQSADSR